MRAICSLSVPTAVTRPEISPSVLAGGRVVVYLRSVIASHKPSAGRTDARLPARTVAHEPYADKRTAATPGPTLRDNVDGLSAILARSVHERRPAAPVAGPGPLLQREIEIFEGPQMVPGQEGQAYVFPGGPKQLYVDAEDNRLYFKSLQSTDTQWVLIEVTPSAKDDPRALEHKGYDRLVPERKRTIAPVKPKPVVAPVKPVVPPSQVVVELLAPKHLNHFYIRTLAGKVDELLGKDQVDVVVGDAVKLGGDTVEVRFSVREKGKAATVIEFVAHYHSEAAHASVEAKYASQAHLKKWTNKWAHKDLEPTAVKYPHLSKLIPKRSDALHNARAPKSAEVLYSPN